MSLKSFSSFWLDKVAQIQNLTDFISVKVILNTFFYTFKDNNQIILSYTSLFHGNGHELIQIRKPYLIVK